MAPTMPLNVYCMALLTCIMRDHRMQLLKYIVQFNISLTLWLYIIFIYYRHKVGRSKPTPVLTSGFNRLKPPRSLGQKVVNTGQYESEWSIENSKGCFCGGLRYLYRFYVLSIEKKNTVLSLQRALFTVRFPSQDLSTEF